MGLGGTAATSLSVEIQVNGRVVGAIENFTVNNNRNVTKLRHLSIEDAGRVVGTVIGVEDISLTLSGFELFSSGGRLNYLFNRIDSNNAENSDGAWTLADQKTAFTIVEKMGVPGGANTHTIVYNGCYFTNYSRSISISGDTKISSNVGVSVETVSVQQGE